MAEIALKHEDLTWDINEVSRNPCVPSEEEDFQAKYEVRYSADVLINPSTVIWCEDNFDHPFRFEGEMTNWRLIGHPEDLALFVLKRT